jgi:hypothetical protein
VAALAAVQLPIVAALAWALAGALGVTGAALARLVAETAVQISAGVMAARLLPRPFAGMARPILAFLVAAGAAAGASLLIFASISGVWGAIFGAAVGVMVGAAVLLLLDRAWALGLREDASKAFPTVMAWLRLAPAPARRNDVRDGGAA